MNEETQARRLAEWLESPPGTAPPEDLDPEVLGGVYALRPDRAPAARVSLDDILGEVREGPFASQTTAPATGFPESAPAGGPEVVGLPTRPAPPTRPARRRALPAWVYPLVGVGFAAAAALTIGLPLVAQQAADRMEHVATEPVAAAPPPPPAAPAAEVAAPPAEEAGPTPDMLAEARPEPKADRESAGVPTGGLGGAAVLGGDADGAVAQTAPVEAPVPADADLIPEVTAAAPATSGLAAAGEGASVGTAGRGYGGGGSAEKAKDEARRDQVVYAEEQLAEYELDDATVSKKASSRAASAPAKSAADVASAPAAAPPAAATATTGATATTSPALETRSRGVPLDYSPSWYTRHPDVTGIYTNASAQEKLGAWAAAAALYAPLYADARLDVAQDAAWRGAKALWAGGDASGALSVVETGLRRGGGNTAFRAHLLVLQGDLLSAMGRTTEARRAWAEAATVNTRRAAPTATEAAEP